MIHASLRVLVCASIAALSFACDVPEFDVDKVIDRAAIRIAKNRWKEQDVHDYQFVYQEECACPTTDPSGVRVDVQNDKAVEAIGNKNGIPYPDAAITLDQLFDEVLAKTEDGADQFDVHFNDERRFIDRLSVDPDDKVADDEFSFNVPCFAPEMIPTSLQNAGVGGIKLSTGGVGGFNFSTGGAGGSLPGTGGGAQLGDKLCPYPLITQDNCVKQNGTVTMIPSTNPSAVCGSGTGMGQVERDVSVCCVP
jgi:hypothetical protein